MEDRRECAFDGRVDTALTGSLSTAYLGSEVLGPAQ